jgi:hypothetical protein
MYYFIPSPYPFSQTRPPRPVGADLDREWEDLRTWVQKHARFIRVSQIAKVTGMSVEVAEVLLLRPIGSARITRTEARLDALLDVFTSPPFCYLPPIES